MPSTTFFDLSEEGLLKVSGTDAKKLLQGQLTCDVEKASSTECLMGAHCNPQGRVIFLFYLFLLQDAYYLAMPHQMVAIALAALKKYAIFYKVALSDASDQLRVIGCINDTSRSRMLSETPPSPSLASFEEWKQLQINNKTPAIYPETSGKFLPHELNLHQLNAIDFEKGCYTGQEIIARMHYRGKLKNHLYLANITSPSPPTLGSDVPSLGMVVDVYQEAYNKYKALMVGEEKK
ncbi:MAG: folate-binding protein [Gammaproteobacteria bacterium]|nr:MAG: folate-binding protein [Gammaproteobacteria bacterium]